MEVMPPRISCRARIEAMPDCDWKKRPGSTKFSGVGGTSPPHEFHSRSPIMNAKTLTVASLALAATIGFATPAFAGDCPSGQEMANALKNAPNAPKSVTDTVIAAIDLGKEIAVDGRQLRTRRLVIEPGGIVPMHSHSGRPALIYTVSGTVVEHRSTCAVPIVHKAGDITREADGISHWWQNEGTEPVVLLSSDVFQG
jgi:quercetin dioxygenase-like cupin family protein